MIVTRKRCERYVVIDVQQLSYIPSYSVTRLPPILGISSFTPFYTFSLKATEFVLTTILPSTQEWLRTTIVEDKAERSRSGQRKPLTFVDMPA